MPTFNQLVRKGRQTAVKKSTAPALQRGYNSLQKQRDQHFFSSEERRMHRSKDRYPEEAELCSAKDRQSTSFQRNRGYQLHSG